MPVTRAQSKEIFEYLMTEVLGQTTDSSLVKFLEQNGFNDHIFLVSMADKDIDTLTYTDMDNTIKPLLLGVKILLCILRCYVLYCNMSGNPIGDDINEWKAITADNFRLYRISPEYAAVMNLPTSAPSLAPVTKRVTSLLLSVDTTSAYAHDQRTTPRPKHAGHVSLKTWYRLCTKVSNSVVIVVKM